MDNIKMTSAVCAEYNEEETIYIKWNYEFAKAFVPETMEIPSHLWILVVYTILIKSCGSSWRW